MLFLCELCTAILDVVHAMEGLWAFLFVFVFGFASRDKFFGGHWFFGIGDSVCLMSSFVCCPWSYTEQKATATVTFLLLHREIMWLVLPYWQELKGCKSVAIEPNYTRLRYSRARIVPQGNKRNGKNIG